jgi:hypothetical protein
VRNFAATCVSLVAPRSPAVSTHSAPRHPRRQSSAHSDLFLKKYRASARVAFELLSVQSRYISGMILGLAYTIRYGPGIVTYG